mgnify:FL=1|tara:strand:+ start:13148 stop:13429 length:282 start_codon:yes stop_codon:yes gene_type:complete
MARHFLINGEKVPFTAEQETARDAEEIKAAADLAAHKYKNDRQFNGSKTYPNITEQLDQLFRDVDAGKFGADAKTGEWYIAIKEVKDSNPKPS